MNQWKELGLKDELAQWMEAQGMPEPTPVQQQVIPKILKRTNLIGQAPTGTGKTYAYLLPLLQMLDADVPQAQAIVLAPTYELGMQIAHAADRIVQQIGSSLRIQALIGGANIMRQVEKLKKKPQLLIGSAGRILELTRKGKVKLSCLRLLVLDEFDRLLDDQNLPAVRELIQRFPDGENIQYLMFSATAPKKALDRADFLQHPELVRLEEKPEDLSRKTHLCCIVPFREKAGMIRKLTRRLEVRRGLVFINRAFDAERTLAKLQYDGIKAGSLLGSADKQARKKAVADFREGRLQLLLSTDLAARGLDIPGIDYVFHLDFPETPQMYLHRAGRTARAGASGTIVLLADPGEAEKVTALERKLGISFQTVNPERKQKNRRISDKNRNRKSSRRIFLREQ